MVKLVKLSDLSLSNKTVLIREDYNVPMYQGAITNDARIKASLPTLQYALKQKAKIIIVSHLGRPTGYDETLSLAPVAKALSQLLGTEVPLIQDWIDGIHTDHDVVLCENVRFHPGEINNDDNLARAIAKLCQIYVNDAFATAHRMHASTYGVTKYVPISVAGPLLEREIKVLSKIADDAEKPILAIVGGSKISSKLTVLRSFVNSVDYIIPGGGITNTFLKAKGKKIGRSLNEEKLCDEAKKVLDEAHNKNCKILLPNDVVCGKSLDQNAVAQEKTLDDIAEDDLIMDLGTQSIEEMKQAISQAKTIIWNGPLGVFEIEQFSHGTKQLASAIAASSAYSVAGGGDTISAIEQFNVAEKINYICTGGGAFIKFLEKKPLPAIAMLEEAARVWTAMEYGREL